MSERNKKFEELIQALASGKATWDRLEQELSAAADLTASQKEDIRTAAQCRRLEQLQHDPIKDENKLQKVLAAFPQVTDGTKTFLDKFWREQLLEEALHAGLRARGQSVGPSDGVRDIIGIYATCDPRDGAQSALARLIPILLHATTGCFERSENSESLEVRHYELANAFRGARVLALLSDSLHKSRPQRSGKTK